MPRTEQLSFIDPLTPPTASFDGYKRNRYPECGCKVIRELSKEPLLHTSESSMATSDEARSDPEPEEKPVRQSRPRMPANICGLRNELEKNAPLMCSCHRKMAILECYLPSMPTWNQQVRSLELSEQQVYETVYSMYCSRNGIRKNPNDSDSCDEQEKNVREVLKSLADHADSPLKLEDAILEVFGPFPEKKVKKKKYRKRARSSRAMEQSGDSSSDEDHRMPPPWRKNVEKHSAGGKDSGAGGKDSGAGAGAGGPKGRKQDAGKLVATKFSARQAARKKQAVAPKAKESSDEDPDSVESDEQEEPMVKGAEKRADADADADADAGVAGPSKAAVAGGVRRRRKKSACRKSKKHHK